MTRVQGRWLGLSSAFPEKTLQVSRNVGTG